MISKINCCFWTKSNVGIYAYYCFDLYHNELDFINKDINKDCICIFLRNFYKL